MAVTRQLWSLADYRSYRAVTVSRHCAISRTKMLIDDEDVSGPWLQLLDDVPRVRHKRQPADL
jgi:hypothetical protein